MQDWVFKLVTRLENLCEKIASLSDLEKLVSLVLQMKDNLTSRKLEIAVVNCSQFSGMYFVIITLLAISCYGFLNLATVARLN